VKIIRYGIKQKHGTIIVFLDNPKPEVDRLKTGFKIKIANVDEKIESISSIDGALIFDKYGDLYSFGVIIDGESKEYAEEDVERGARYNSSIKYSASVKQKCLIVVVSEDGYVDYISGGKKVM
jgi:DNA integrity scanning protein DisA with diadenylate cyclase activity